MFKNKWLVCACVIVCILAYYGEDHEADFAKGATQPVSCTAAASANDPASPALSTAEAEHQCSAIRNMRRHRQG